MMSSPSPVQVQTPQPMPPPPQPSPQPPTSQPNSASSGPTPSPGGFQPSPSPQPSHSPATARTPQNYGVPSPGPLNTPGNPSSVMSPAGATSLEDQQYMEKLKQLSKYIEPLRRMINKIDKNEDRKKDLSKMKSLLNILTDPNTRCPLRTLQKCEIALEKLKNDMAVVRARPPASVLVTLLSVFSPINKSLSLLFQPTPPPPPVPTKQQYLCQPLLDAVMANIRSPVFNHSLYRTFAPAMAAIHGPPITGPNVSGRKRKHEEDERQTIPNILQGEVARLDVKFLVNLDPSFCSNNGTVHLVCKLDDKNLPSVPPLQLSVPADYPEQSPYWADDGEQYGANSFLQTVHRNMTSKLLQLPDKHSVTELLNTWAQSVRQACLSAA
uniref:Mediator complex subunit 15 n=1 Tax=Lates calcarifer TaxID=8187 RepID=A0A4W6FAW5_LATCA